VDDEDLVLAGEGDDQLEEALGTTRRSGCSGS
jgi:hypothetical protein